MKTSEHRSGKNAVIRKRMKKESPPPLAIIDTSPSPAGTKGLASHPALPAKRTEPAMPLQNLPTRAAKPRPDAGDPAGALPTGLFTLDEEGTVLAVNETGASLLGFSQRALTGKPFSRFIAPEKAPLFESHLRKAAVHKAPLSCRLTAVGKGGRQFDALLQTSSLPDDNGSRRYQSFLCDLTETEKTREEQPEEALRYAAEIDAVFTAQNDIVLLYDTQMTVRRANAAFLEMYGFDPVGLHVQDIAARVSCRRLDGLPFHWEEQPTPRALKGERVTGSFFQVSKADGTRAAIETSSSPIRTGKRITGSVTVWHDITGMKQPEEILRKSAEHYRNVADFTYDWEFWINPDGWFHYISPSAERIIGRRIDPDMRADDLLRQIVHPEDLEERLKHLQVELIGQGSGEMEFRIIRPDGEVRWMHHVCHPIHDPRGHFLGVRGANRDVTEQNRMASALREREATLRGILDASKDTIWLFGPDGAIIMGNETAFRRMERPAEEVVGKRFQDLLDAPVISSRLAHLRETVESGRPVEFEDERNGFIFRHSYYPVTDAAGRVNRIACFSHDITDEKEAERALRENEARFRLLSITAGRLLGSDDPQAIVENVCREVMTQLDCQVFFNYLVEDRTGRLRLNACAGIPAEEIRKIEWMTYGAGVCGLVARERNCIVVEDILRTSGDQTRVVRSFGIQAYCCHPLMAQDHLIGTLSFGARTRTQFTPTEVELMRVVTDQVAVAIQHKQTEQRLREAKNELERRVEERTRELKAASIYTRRLIETNLDPLVTISADGKITDVNAATELATGTPRSELLGSDFSDYFTEPEKARTGYKKVFLEGFVRDYPLAIRHRSGRITEVLYNASIYKNEDGSIQGVFAAARDVTELRQAQRELHESYEELERRVERRTADLKVKTEQLEAANKELESFSYSVSHDLRAPLRAIDGYARMLLKKHGDEFDEESTRRFNIIRSNAQMMGQLIDDLLSFSRLSRAYLSMAELDMDGLIREVWREVTDNGGDRRPVFLVTGLPAGRGDRTLIRQVLSNLLSNAVKFSSGRAEAHVEAGGYRQANENVYYIKDNGVGFDMQYYDKLFGVFQRLHSAEDFEGTGVGLAIVQRIVHRHGGRVWAESRENEGATFYFSLPSPLPQ